MDFEKVQETEKRKAIEIAEQILRLIREGEYGKGNKLPSENRIASLTGVGRPVVREALCALQIVGIIESKVGNGSYVRAESNNEVQPRILSLFRANESPFEILQARKYLESGIVELAAKVATFVQITDLEQILKEANKSLGLVEGEAGEELLAIYLNYDRTFHTRIAEIAGNSLLLGHVAFYCEVMNQVLWRKLYSDFYLGKNKYREALKEHSEIVQAIKNKDVNLARQRMQKHFDNTIQRLIQQKSALQEMDLTVAPP